MEDNNTNTTTTTTTAVPSTSTPPTTDNTAIPTSTPQPPAQTQTQTLSFREKLDAGEQYWLWKLSLRVALLVVAVIGTGCLGWAAQVAERESSYWLYNNQSLLWYTLITFGITIIWTLIYILVLLLRRPPRPVHPGVAVGLDLVLWMTYIITVFCAAVACASVLSLGSAGTLSGYSSDGYYTMASNGTWVYNPSSYMLRYGESRDCESNSTLTSTYSTYSTYYHGYYSPEFENCAEQDAWVNALWKASKNRAGVVVTGTVCQALCLLLHFMLFVWACVDTHRRNKGKTNVDAEKLAADIVTKMVRDGAILQAPGAQQRHQQFPSSQQQQQYQAPGQQQQQLPYTAHQGPPPPLLNPQHPARRSQRDLPPLPQIVEHYANEKGPRGVEGPVPAHQPIVEHYGNDKAGVAPHAI